MDRSVAVPSRARGSATGVMLVEAMAALAVTGLVALAVSALASGAIRASRRANHLAGARRGVASAAVRVASCSWARLPGYFGATPDDRLFRADSARDPGHPAVSGLARSLPGGRVIVRVEPLGPRGSPVPFRDAVACRVRVSAAWREEGRLRRVEVTDVRY